MEAAPQGPSAPDQQKSGGAEQAIKMIQDGFGTLSKMIQSAGQNVDPKDVKLFQQAVMATDNFVQAIMGSPDAGGEEAPPQRPQQSGPMPANANAGAKPAPQY